MDTITIAVDFANVPKPTPKPSKTWIQTLEGRKLEPLALTVEMVGSIEEIAHALAGKVRFTGQTAQRLSVAEHCVRGSRLLPSAYAGAFLLHELSEVYLPDIAAPLKPFVFIREPDVDVPPGTIRVDEQEDGSALARIYPWADLEREHTRVILAALNLASLEPLIYSPEIKRMDLAMLLAEKRDLCGPEPEPWGIPGAPADTGPITPWRPDVAEDQFLERFRQLFGVL